MAFNPFNWFRKHQKVLFAGLILLTMLVFIGQFGRGDIFDRGMTWFGGERVSGQLVATLNGKKVHESDLVNLARKRRLARFYLSNNAFQAYPAVCKELLDEVKGAAPGNPLSNLREIVEQTQQRMSGFGQFQLRGEEGRERLRQDLRQLESIATREKVKDSPEQLAKLQRVATIIGFQMWMSHFFDRIPPQQFIQLLQQQRGMVVPSHEFYYGGTESPEDMLDFVLWQQQADRLGIQLTDEDVQREVVAAAAGHDVFEGGPGRFIRNPKVTTFMQMYRGDRSSLPLTPSDLLEALRQEFRVAMAQAAVLGEEQGARAYRNALATASSPVLASPDEFFSFFRKNRTTLKVELLKISTQQFLPGIKDQPSDAELADLFEVYKDREPFAASRDPGFKEPRRIAIEYVSANSEDPYYQKLARKKVEAHLAFPALTAITAPVLGKLIATFNPVQQKYDEYLTKEEHAWFNNPKASLTDEEKQRGQLHLSSVIDARAVVPMFASLQGGALTGLTSLYASATAVEVRESVRFTLTQLLASAEPQQLLSMATLTAAAMPKPVPLDVLEPVILAGLVKTEASNAVNTALSDLRTELEKLRGQTKNLRETVDKALKKSADGTGPKLQHYRMAKPATHEALANLFGQKSEPALNALRDAILPQLRLPPQQMNNENVAASFFGPPGTYDPRQVFSSDTNKTDFLYWHAEDLPARQKRFGEARDEVIAAWRLEKARREARQHAESLRAEINKKKLTPNAATAVLLQQKQGQTFELENVAQLLPQKAPLAGRGGTIYVPYNLPDHSIAEFPYPPQDLASRLMSLERPGEAMVVVDRPARNYYVAVLQERKEPSMAEFKAVYARTPRDDSLYLNFLSQQRTDYRRSLVQDLRREAGADLDSEGRYKLPEALQKRESVLSEQGE